MKRLLLLLMWGLLVLPLKASALEAVCPDWQYECVPYDFWAEYVRSPFLDASLDLPPVRDWERPALELIMGGNEGKSYVDILDQDCGAHSFVHLQPGNGILEELGVTDFTPDLDYCAVDDPVWRAQMEDAIYSPIGIAAGRAAWLDIIEPRLERARRHGLVTPVQEAAIAAMLNSDPALVRDLGRETGWHLVSMVHGYGASRPGIHRKERALRILELLLEEG